MRQLPRDRLHQRDDAPLRRRVIARTGIAPQPRDARSRDDGALGVFLPRRRGFHGRRRVLGGHEDGEQVRAQDVHEVVRGDVFEEAVCAGDAGVGEEDVELAVTLQGGGDEGLDGGLVRGIELLRVDRGGGEEGGELALVRREVRGVEVAEVDGARALGGELVRCCAADAEEGVGA